MGNNFYLAPPPLYLCWVGLVSENGWILPCPSSLPMRVRLKMFDSIGKSISELR
jgi:hypothetical protein